MDKDSYNSASPSYWCCLMFSSFKFDCRSNPNTVPKNSGFCQNIPQTSCHPARLGCCLFVLNTRLELLPELMADFSPTSNKPGVQERKSATSLKANQLGKDTNCVLHPPSLSSFHAALAILFKITLQLQKLTPL